MSLQIRHHSTILIIGLAAVVLASACSGRRFNPEDAQEVINEVLTSSFHRLVQDTTVANRMLRLKTS
jgi:hypothetical protein